MTKSDIIIFLIVVVVFILFSVISSIFGGKKLYNRHQNTVIGRGNRRQQELMKASAYNTLKQKDPTFSYKTFVARIKNAFHKIQHAWCNQDLSAVEHFISDGICERFNLQFKEQQADGRRDHMEDITVYDCDIVHFESDSVYDTVTLRIRAAAIDYKVSIENGSYISGDKHNLIEFVEYWSFLRRTGVKSISGEGLIEGACPNCGSALNMNQFAKCESCGSLLKSGEYDWILSEITQESVWTYTVSRDITGVRIIKKKDPEFSIQELEDRASIIFWRIMSTYRFRDISFISKIADEDYREWMSHQIALDGQGNRKLIANAAVGSVETLAVISEADYDQAIVRIRWSGFEYLDDGHFFHEQRQLVGQSTLYLLHRDQIPQSHALGLSSTHCPSCGAPESFNESNACDYCGSVHEALKETWQLSNCSNSDYSKIMSLMHEANNETSLSQPVSQPRAELMAWMIRVMLADGKIDNEEMDLLKHYADLSHLSSADLEKMINSAKNGTLEVAMPASTDEASEWLSTMAEMALADGNVDNDEMNAILSLGKYLDFTKYDVRQIILKKKRQLYKQHRDRLKSKGLQ